jgi:outer membrane protein insertion porin family
VDSWGSNTRVLFFDRYFLGGASSIRGFRNQDVGPHDIYGEPVGGDTYWSATAEYTYPIVERIRGAFFFDVGNVYPQPFSLNPRREVFTGTANDYKRQFLNAGTGVGVRLNLPIGPIRFDLGFPVISDPINNHGMQFHFNVGYQF